MKASDYKAIAAWGRMLGSYSYYIKTQQNLAAETNAPIDAIYCRDGVWARLSEVTNQNTEYYFEQNHPDLFHEYMVK